MKKNKTYWRIYCTVTKKYLLNELTGGFLVFPYNTQGWSWIQNRLGGSSVYKVVEWRKRK